MDDWMDDLRRLTGALNESTGGSRSLINDSTALDAKMSRQFVWLVGAMMTLLTAVVGGFAAVANGFATIAAAIATR